MKAVVDEELIPIGDEKKETIYEEEQGEGRETADELEAARQEAADYKDK